MTLTNLNHIALKVHYIPIIRVPLHVEFHLVDGLGF